MQWFKRSTRFVDDFVELHSDVVLPQVNVISPPRLSVPPATARPKKEKTVNSHIHQRFPSAICEPKSPALFLHTHATPCLNTGRRKSFIGMQWHLLQRKKTGTAPPLPRMSPAALTQCAFCRTASPSPFPLHPMHSKTHFLCIVFSSIRSFRTERANGQIAMASSGPKTLCLSTRLSVSRIRPAGLSP